MAVVWLFREWQENTRVLRLAHGETLEETMEGEIAPPGARKRQVLVHCCCQMERAQGSCPLMSGLIGRAE